MPEDLEEYVIAFGVLTRSRSIGMALGPVPLTEMEAYCRLFDVVDVEMFVRLITAMDIAYLDVKLKQET